MAKIRTEYCCQQCGSIQVKWLGQCPDCFAWNSFTEQKVTPHKLTSVSHYAGETEGVIVHLCDIPVEQVPRSATGLEELDRVLGGGLVDGSVVLIGGDPGIGKSTLLLQTLAHLSTEKTVLYITGEESLRQVSLRASRLGIHAPKMSLLTETRVEAILNILQTLKPSVVVIDSIQTLFHDAISSAPGSVSQIRESAARLVQYAKQHHTSIFLVGHVTKEGQLAGPRVLEHMVDTVLYFEGSSHERFRMIRAVKNRFGAVNELGIFAMTEKGLKEIHNPSALLLSHSGQPTPGSVVSVMWEGTRPLLIELQALVDSTSLGNPRRIAVGMDQQRLAMQLAILNRHGHVATHQHDVFINAVGGIKISETSTDLAILLAITSSLKHAALPEGLIVLGEVGLAGEIRPVLNGQERLREAAKHGFTKAIIPKANMPKTPMKEIECFPVQQVQEMLQLFREWT